MKRLIALFSLAGISLLGQEQPTPSPFQSIIDAFAYEATFPPSSIVKEPLEQGESSSAFTTIKGSISGGSQDGRKYLSQCVKADCEFTLLEWNGAGRSTFQTLGDTIFITADSRAEGVINAKDLIAKTPRREDIEIIGPNNQVIAVECPFELQTVVAVEDSGEVSTRTVEGFGKCKPLDPDQLIPPEKAARMADDIQRLSDDRPMSLRRNQESIQRTVVAAASYLTERKSSFSEKLKTVINKLHLKLDPFTFLPR